MGTGDGENRVPIVERTITYSARIIRLYNVLIRDSAGRVLGRQLLGSATSVGANTHEAQAAQSRADFISKISIAREEAREPAYWLRLIAEAELVPPTRVAELGYETEQIVRIPSSILISTNSRTEPSSGAGTRKLREDTTEEDSYGFILNS